MQYTGHFNQRLWLKGMELRHIHLNFGLLLSSKMILANPPSITKMRHSLWSPSSLRASPGIHSSTGPLIQRLPTLVASEGCFSGALASNTDWPPTCSILTAAQGSRCSSRLAASTTLGSLFRGGRQDAISSASHRKNTLSRPDAPPRSASFNLQQPTGTIPWLTKKSSMSPTRWCKCSSSRKLTTFSIMSTSAPS